MARIVITIPTWNEATVIERNLSALRDASARFFVEHEVAIEVADNGSTDATREIASRIEGVSIHVVEGRGKGIAIRRSWEKHAESADVLVFTDADLAADLSALPHLIRPIISGEADLVCGSRFVAGAVVERKIVREAASHLYRALQRVILGLPVQDAHCGFKAISSGTARRLLPHCREDGWMFDSELLMLASRSGRRIFEIPVNWTEHRDPARRSALSLWRHGWGFLAGLLRIRRRRLG